MNIAKATKSKVAFGGNMLRELLGLATVSLVALAVLSLAAFAVIPLTGWDWIPVVGASRSSAPEELGSLKGVPIPEPANLREFVRDREAAVKLGKALFWDMQVGSDGIQACASCHFQAGTDRRSKHQVDPGRHAGDTLVNLAPLNAQLSPADFPTHRLADPEDSDSDVLFDTNDVVSSQGIFAATFVDIVPGQAEELGSFAPDPIFSVNGQNLRKVEPIDTMTVINTIFNFRSFFQGRAQNAFNGVNLLGDRDPDAFVLKAVGPTQADPVQVRLENSSLASQSLGALFSSTAMNYSGRTGPKVGKKMLSLTPLAKQLVHFEDSVLAPHSLWPEPGLSVTYEKLIETAFQPEWWDSDLVVDADGNLVEAPSQPLTTGEFTLPEFNFTLFFGLAIQLYEATLVSDDAPFDRFMDGDKNALNKQQETGLGIFKGKGQCSKCHGGPLFTNATVDQVSEARLERISLAEGGHAIADKGFFNIGVRPTAEDLGNARVDPFGNPWSEALLAQRGLFVDTSPDGVDEVTRDDRVAADGAFKTPHLRNVELTAPFFHNGGQATLRQVVEFYDRGGDFPNENVSGEIKDLNLSEEDIEALVDFMRGLTDERVRFQRAPFDHPQIFVPNGHVLGGPDLLAETILVEIPAVGRNGGDPLPTFLEGLGEAP